MCAGALAQRFPATPRGTSRRRSAGAAVQERIEFLSRAESYGASVRSVEVVETHLSLVFLTEHEAWKLKRPLRTAALDLTTPAARRRNAEQELALNRRLAPDVYREVVALRRGRDGALHLDESGTAVDWLVRMRRLPAALMLDRVLARGRVAESTLDALVAVLCRFHARAARVAIEPHAYAERFRSGIEENGRELADARFALPAQLVGDVHARQRAALARCEPLLHARAGRGHIVEAHGDLRPEHVCLESPPVVIDCLDSVRVLRELDPADEIAYLALECERLGAAADGRDVLHRYCGVANDDVAHALLDFYASFRAGVRARLAIRHLAASTARDAKWRAMALAYLDLARDHARACTG